jgi:uncharacterized membrane protein YphA (DoxX/SURF4 family)
MFESAPTGPSWGLVLVRIVVGALLLAAGFEKLANGVGEELVLGTKERVAAGPAFYRAFAEGVVYAHPWLFAKLIAVGELLGGLALFLGAFTRPVACLLAFQLANFWFAAPQESQPLVIVMLAACLGCALSSAGRKAGADVFLVERLPRWLTWTTA